MSIEIKSGRPVPPISRRCKYPFPSMELGQCIEPKTQEEYLNCRTAAHAYGRKHGKKFVSRIVDGTFGVWRVA